MWPRALLKVALRGPGKAPLRRQRARLDRNGVAAHRRSTAARSPDTSWRARCRSDRNAHASHAGPFHGSVAGDGDCDGAAAPAPRSWTPVADQPSTASAVDDRLVRVRVRRNLDDCGRRALDAQRMGELSVPIALRIAVAVIVLWHCSPARQRCLNACHRLPTLRVFGTAAQLDSLRFGLATGCYCAATCGLVMLLVLLVKDHHLMVMAAAAAMTTFERHLPARRPGWQLPMLLRQSPDWPNLAVATQGSSRA